MITVYAANILTWYEGSLFVLFSSVLGAQFFPEKTPMTALIHIFVIYSVGFISRPLGTLFFSHVGDKIGRRIALILSIALMTIPTFGIGLVPSYYTIGIAAPLLVLFMRLIQGFAAGGEFPGTMCYLYEVTPARYRGFTGSLTFSASQFGNVFSTIEFLLLEKHLSPEVLGSIGWRISFILGGFFGLIAWFLRRTLHETPLFEVMKTEGKIAQRPIFEAFTNYKLIMGKAFCLSAFTLAGWYIIFIFSPIYFSKVIGMNDRHLLYINMGLFCLSSLLMPLFGYLFDQHNKKVLFYSSAFATLILCIPFYFSASHQYFSLPLFIITEVVLSILLTVQFAILPVMIAGLFPQRLRYTCVGVSYNFCNILFGGATPLILLTITDKTGFFLAPAIVLILTALISVWAFTKLEKQM